MKVIKRIGISIFTIVLCLLFIYSAYNFICINILHKDLVDIKGYAVLEVVSGSMEPTIHIGDLVVINTNETNYQENDIVTFYDVEGSFVTHRIVSINDTEMITKGDNNNAEDEATATDKIVGKYLFRVALIGRILSSFRNPFVMIMILLIGILVCYLVSTDKDGKPILTEEEKEYEEFLDYQNTLKKDTIIKKKSTTKVSGKPVDSKSQSKKISTIKLSSEPKSLKATAKKTTATIKKESTKKVSSKSATEKVTKTKNSNVTDKVNSKPKTVAKKTTATIKKTSTKKVSGRPTTTSSSKNKSTSSKTTGTKGRSSNQKEK